MKRSKPPCKTLNKIYMPQTKIPKGKLLIIGGAEHKGEDENLDMVAKNKKFKQYEILGELLPPEHRKKHSIELITTASEEPIETEARYLRTFQRVGFPSVGVIHIGSKEEARNPEYIKRVENAHAVLFTGGDQFRLATILGETEIVKAIKKKYCEDSDFIIAGTSAGAMAISTLMIYYGNSYEALLKGDLKITSGLGVIDKCIIDTHFVKRGRFGRLSQAIIMNPSCIGIGLGEDTALIIKKGNQAECRGSGMVIIIDGSRIKHTNIANTEDGEPLCVENLKVHILASGNGYLLAERKFVPEKNEGSRKENVAKKEQGTKNGNGSSGNGVKKNHLIRSNND